MVVTRAIRGLADGVHELRILALGEARPAATATKMSIDGFSVVPRGAADLAPPLGSRLTFEPARPPTARSGPGPCATVGRRACLLLLLDGSSFATEGLSHAGRIDDP
jgi:hypothetical protein